MADRARPAVAWFLIGASALLGLVTLYVVFAGFLPAQQRAAWLEQELKALYTQEAQLHGTLAQIEQRLAERDQQIQLLRAERDALARRIEELQQRRGPRPPLGAPASPVD